MTQRRKIIVIGKIHIPLGALRRRLKDRAEEKNKGVICYCKISPRSHESALVLEGNGWKSIKAMASDIIA